MIESRLQQAHINGYERIVAWGDLLDQINVFPVADSDTGQNLKVSLAPLLGLKDRPDTVRRRLLLSATGNSGNIAAAFFTEFLAAGTADRIPEAAKTGRDRAWNVLAAPQPGTMLSVMDALATALADSAADPCDWDVDAIVNRLTQVVRDTPDQLPVLQEAGVVDAGALGLYIYLEGFFRSLAGTENNHPSVMALFGDRLRISEAFTARDQAEYCVDTLIQPYVPGQPDLESLSAHGQSVIAVADAECLKIHLHTDNRERLRKAVDALGEVVNWKESPISGDPLPVLKQSPDSPVHIMTDAAGSLTRVDAARLGITLLDSILMVDGEPIPETLFSPVSLYSVMRAGRPVATAQASLFFRHQQYQSVMSRYPRVLYLCVGSIYTTNYQVACAWKEENDPHDRLTILDSSAASGKLGATALATARFAPTAQDFESVLKYARWAIDHCQELIFLDQLKYLARGGRISKTKGFFGDLLNKKPVITPMASGAEKAGLVKNRDQQVRFAMMHLEQWMGPESGRPLIMLEFTDNRPWLQQMVGPAVRSLCPEAEIVFQPLSLTSGAHMGPGTWGIAFLPEYVP